MQHGTAQTENKFQQNKFISKKIEKKSILITGGMKSERCRMKNVDPNFAVRDVAMVLQDFVGPALLHYNRNRKEKVQGCWPAKL